MSGSFGRVGGYAHGEDALGVAVAGIAEGVAVLGLDDDCVFHAIPDMPLRGAVAARRGSEGHPGVITRLPAAGWLRFAPRTRPEGSWGLSGVRIAGLGRCIGG